MINKELKTEAREIEILTADDEKLRRMLGGLEKVGAPKNFDFHLKARIANAKPEDLRQSQPLFLPWLRYVLPLSVIVLLAGFAFFNLSFSTGNQNGSDVAADLPPIQNEIKPPETDLQPQIETPFTASANDGNKSESVIRKPEIVNTPKKPIQDNPNFIAVKSLSGKQSEKVRNKANDNFNGMRQETLRTSEVITPQNANRNFGDPKQVSGAEAKIPLREILARIGIEAVYADKGWKITSVKEKSLAIISDMKVGDLIEAIDDKKLSSDTVFEQAFTGKVFRVLRDGKQILIELNAK